MVNGFVNIAILAFWLVLSGNSDANQLVNGSFEAGLSGWVSAGPVKVRSDEQPSDGLYSLVLDDGDIVGGSIQQSFSIASHEPGYLLSFDYWGWAAPTVHTVLVEVIYTGAVLLRQTISVSGSIPPIYNEFRSIFQVPPFGSSTALLRFTDLTTAANGVSSDINIDRLSIVVIPEPSTFMLIASGVSVLLIAIGKRKNTRIGFGSA